MLYYYKNKNDKKAYTKVLTVDSERNKQLAFHTKENTYILENM